MLPFRVTALSAVLLLTGCTPYTYINIPSQVGDVAQHSPNSATARQLQHLALVALLAKSPFDGLFQVILPVGSTQQTYDRVLPLVSDLARPPQYVPEGGALSVIEVTGVRARGARAAVDIVTEDGLSTVYLRYSMGASWGADRIHSWGKILDVSTHYQPATGPLDP